jgi:hypothetical protein
MQTREQIKNQMRDNALFIRSGLTLQPLVIEPVVLKHDPLFDLPQSQMEREHDQRVLEALVEGAEYVPDR